MNIARIRTATAAAASILLAGAAAPAAAQSQNIVAPETRAGGGSAGGRASAQEDTRRICVRVELTGSRVARNVCRTRTEWERAGGIPTSED